MYVSNQYKKLYKTFIALSIFSLILPNLYIFAQDKVLQPPKDLNEPKEIGQKILEVLKNFPKIIGNVFEEEVLPFWKKIWNWFKDNVWLRIVNWVKKEVKEKIEKRKPTIEKEIEEEKEEIKKGLWERFQDWFKRK